MELDPQVSPEEIMSREVELGCESWTSFASGCSSTAVQRTLSLRLCPAQQLKQQLRSALVAAQWRGDTALTLPLFWRRSTVSPVFFGRYPRSNLHSLPPPPPPAVPVPNKQPRFCGRKATWSRRRKAVVNQCLEFGFLPESRPPLRPSLLQSSCLSSFMVPLYVHINHTGSENPGPPPCLHSS